MENWRSIPWTNDFYEVSDLGRVRSKDRVYERSNGRPFTAYGRLLPVHWSDGYLRVRLNVPGFPKWHMVHKLVMETFVGPRPDGMVIRHLDGSATNCALTNLKYGTNSENQMDRKDHGTWHDKTERRLDDGQIIQMRERRASGEMLKVLANEFGVSASYVMMVCTGKAAPFVGGPIVAPRPRGRQRALTDEQETEIIRRRAAGELIVPLGKEFGVSHSLISKIYKRSCHEDRIG